MLVIIRREISCYYRKTSLFGQFCFAVFFFYFVSYQKYYWWVEKLLIAKRNDIFTAFSFNPKVHWTRDTPILAN